ncbi:hypothetical protein B0T22DRAFT_523438 [Podospora appendiculata]|uniref:Uncharacterized protein n=1 Tax=Podospora appendiculata TaxID=314037 RepID=A0AAE0WZ31_9PEZI|nr:hypothetical protein B0T22DRAFT_523438 [Podospora appendiculata]
MASNRKDQSPQKQKPSQAGPLPSEKHEAEKSPPREREKPKPAKPAPKATKRDDGPKRQTSLPMIQNDKHDETAPGDKLEQGRGRSRTRDESPHGPVQYLHQPMTATRTLGPATTVAAAPSPPAGAAAGTAAPLHTIAGIRIDRYRGHNGRWSMSARTGARRAPRSFVGPPQEVQEERGNLKGRTVGGGLGAGLEMVGSLSTNLERMRSEHENKALTKNPRCELDLSVSDYQLTAVQSKIGDECKLIKNFSIQVVVPYDDDAGVAVEGDYWDSAGRRARGHWRDVVIPRKHADRTDYATWGGGAWKRHGGCEEFSTTGR